MRNIPLQNADRKVLKIWLKRSSKLLAELTAETDIDKRKALIDKYKKHWRKEVLVDWLAALSNDKCWYTETYFGGDYPEIEHFRPKKEALDEKGKKFHEGYWWFAFDIDNYRLSKPMPNRKKGCYFPLRDKTKAVNAPGGPIDDEDNYLLDPIVEEDCYLLSFNEIGNAVPEAGLSDWKEKRVDYSIERYKLNDDRLCRRRKLVWMTCRGLLAEYQNKAKKADETGSAKNRGEAQSILKNLRDMIKQDKEFSSVAKTCLLRSSDPIAQQVACSI